MLHCLDTQENTELREFLQNSDYTTEALIQTFGHTENPQSHLLKLSLIGKSLEPGCRNILLRWFWVGGPIETSLVREWIPQRIIDLMLKGGMILAQGDALTSVIRISPFNGYMILSDHATARTGELHAGTVLWPNPTTMMCYHLSMRSPVDRMLDLGTGNGVLAISASGHCGSIVATDLNPRAQEFCEFNAALNSVTNVEYREGNSFEPVRGELFDLILANPPFFVTPTVRRVYSDNSMELDGFCRSLVRQAPGHLKEGGYCQMLVEWVQLAGQPWRDRMNEWFEGLGCDVWVLVDYMRSSLDYALIRIQEDRDETTDPAAIPALVDKWQHYFADRQVEGIFGGMIVMRRREGQNWTRMEELTSLPSRPFGDFMRRVFENRDYLSSHSDEQLLDCRPLLPATARMVRQFAISPEGWKPTTTELHLTEGLPVTLALQPLVASFVSLCDGKRTLAEIADQTAKTVSVDPAAVRKESCNIIRRFADRGVVLL